MSKGNSNAEDAPSERPWQTTQETATEWGPETVEDMSEGVLLTTGEFSAYAKDLVWDNDDGSKGRATKYYAYVRVGSKTLPCRINKYSMDDLSKAWGDAVGAWHNRAVILVVDRKGKWPFVVVKPKPGIAGKGKGRRKA